MTNNTETNNKNQRDEFTPLVVDHGNTTEEEGATTMMTTITATIRRSPKALLLLGLAATAAVSNTAWNQYQTPPPPLAQLNKSTTGGGKPIVTVVNNCPNTQVLYNGPGTNRRETACTGSKCSEFAAAGNAAFYIGRYGYATMAELNVEADGGAWVDISRIEGFNFGVSIKDKAGVSPVNLVCNGVNCKDAYWLCENSDGNPLFSPNTKLYANEIVVTFCPQGEADTDYFHTTNKCNGVVQNAQADTTKASYKCWAEWKPVTTCGGGGGGGGERCDSWCHGDWDNRNAGRHCAPGNMADKCGGCDYCSLGSGGGGGECTPEGGDMYYHPGKPDGKLDCCAGLHEVINGAYYCRR